MKALKSILALATSFCLTTGLFSALSVNSITYADDESSHSADGGFSAEQIANSEVKPVIAATQKVITLDEAKAPQTIEISVAGANAKYAATGFHIYYDKRLDIELNQFGYPKVSIGDAAKYLTTKTPEVDPTAADYDMKGIFVCSASDNDRGLDGVFWKFDVTLPADTAEGDVFPIDILYRSNRTNEDLFVNVNKDETGRLMQAYTFTQGIYNRDTNNTFKAPAKDVAQCAALVDIKGEYDGYIAIADNKAITTTSTTTTTKVVTTTTTTTPVTKNFIWGVDNWSFDNSDKYFSSYDVNSYVMNKMAKDFNLTRIDVEELKDQIEIDNFYGFNGSCFGMTVSEILAKQGDLKLSRYGGNDIVNKNSNTSNMTSVINFIQELQSNSHMCQSIRQSAILKGEYTQPEFVSKLVSTLNNNNYLIKVSYAIATKNKSNNEITYGFHAVLAYGVENCDYYSDVTGKNYDMRILIADPNYLSGNKIDNEACIYYNSSDYSWIVPYWNTDFRNYVRTCYWNAISSTTSNGYIRNIMKYNSLKDTVNLMSNSTTEHYIAGLQINNISQNETLVSQIVNSGNPNLDNAGQSGNIVLYNVEMNDTINSNNYNEFYALWNPTASYELSYNKLSSFDLKMDYEEIAYFADVSNASYALFKPSGQIDMRGSNASYDISIITNDSECVTDWYTVEVSGKNVDNLSYTKTSDGYILSSNNLKDVTVSAHNDDVATQVAFSTDYLEAFIFEIDEYTIGVAVDTDDNGTFETVIAKSDKGNAVTRLGDANCDGVVSIADSTAILQSLGNPDKYGLSAEGKANADCCDPGNGVNTSDALAIQKLDAKIITALPEITK